MGAYCLKWIRSIIRIRQDHWGPKPFHFPAGVHQMKGLIGMKVKNTTYSARFLWFRLRGILFPSPICPGFCFTFGCADSVATSSVFSPSPSGAALLSKAEITAWMASRPPPTCSCCFLLNRRCWVLEYGERVDCSPGLRKLWAKKDPRKFRRPLKRTINKGFFLQLLLLFFRHGILRLFWLAYPSQNIHTLLHILSRAALNLLNAKTDALKHVPKLQLPLAPSHFLGRQTDA